VEAPDGLDDVGVVADEQVDAGIGEQPAGQGPLGWGGRRAVFLAPVQEHHGEPGAGPPGGPGVGQDPARRDQVDQPRPPGWGVEAVQAVGVAQEGDADPADGEDARPGLAGAAGGAGMT
jgi:hypothetical protein